MNLDRFGQMVSLAIAGLFSLSFLIGVAFHGGGADLSRLVV